MTAFDDDNKRPFNLTGKGKHDNDNIFSDNNIYVRIYTGLYRCIYTRAYLMYMEIIWLFYTKKQWSQKDHRIWYKLTNKTYPNGFD